MAFIKVPSKCCKAGKTFKLSSWKLKYELSEHVNEKGHFFELSIFEQSISIVYRGHELCTPQLM